MHRHQMWITLKTCVVLAGVDSKSLGPELCINLNFLIFGIKLHVHKRVKLLTIVLYVKQKDRRWIHFSQQMPLTAISEESQICISTHRFL